MSSNENWDSGSGGSSLRSRRRSQRRSVSAIPENEEDSESGGSLLRTRRRSQRASVSVIDENEDASEWSIRSSFRDIKLSRSEMAAIERASEETQDPDVAKLKASHSSNSMQLDSKQLDVLKDFLFDSWSLDSPEGNRRDASTSSIDVDLGSVFETTFDLTEDRLRRLFDLFDESNDGTISYDELKLGFKYHGSNFGMSKLDDRTFSALVGYLDADDSGEITFEEFSEGIRLLMLRAILQQVNRSGSSSKDAVITQVYDYNITKLSRYLLQGKGQVQQRTVSFVLSKPLIDFFLSERGDEVSVRWINITGKKASSIIKMMALKYRLHPLALEDALERFDHRPKADSYDKHYFIMVPVFYLKGDEKALDPAPCKEKECSWYERFLGGGDTSSETNSDDELSIDEDDGAENNLIGVHMTSIFITRPSGKTVITFNNDITFKDDKNDGMCWQKLHDELKKDYSKLRQYDGQYLAYRLLDESVDKIGEIVKKLKILTKKEKRSLERNHYRDLDRIHSLKQEMYSMNRKFKPFLRLLVHVIEDDSFSPGASIYLRDVLDNLEIHDDDLKALIAKCDDMDEEAEKLQAKQMDSTLYTLTVATVTILPAQFLTGVWGMNFETMPELKWQYGYSIFWVLAICTSIFTISILNFSRRSTNF
uniref:EF-hand domain-containing protein n=1 Tax=Pseudo-nitzschia delicatissima TaxID=44447 RepID=A0A7S0T9I4_9STRA|mmetsp:Transcript_296/g.637  ORF Transcript_296/g.637 Transcript_296/m.637 type:complete len:652 (+) Transcript_296:270-2225(+)|eukprot:CAMPEP_0116100916 /NCGR_PEP_ID=MMETSP0327-20121206/12535_1 /TAXON_ID=44447 /ORGANISM="Pseudo-nitzschia delicatissima, Strain B596" /LENGTH=651 /DNA_ID=CAMNT_0003592849 /DNA_START=243 /DNA_END=2198 /DNA_ORIENTATION=+